MMTQRLTSVPARRASVAQHQPTPRRAVTLTRLARMTRRIGAALAAPWRDLDPLAVAMFISARGTRRPLTEAECRLLVRTRSADEVQPAAAGLLRPHVRGTRRRGRRRAVPVASVFALLVLAVLAAAA